MDYDLEYKAEALANLERLTQRMRERIVKKIHWLVKNFPQITHDPLTGNLSGLFKLRVGDYRVLYSFSDELKTIAIHRIGQQKDVYD